MERIAKIAVNRLVGLAIGIVIAGSAHAAEPSSPRQILSRLCSDCHSADAAEGDLVIPMESWSEATSSSLKDWENIQAMVSRGIMPPPDCEQPTKSERDAVLAWLDRALVTHLEVGGTMLRRLSSREYANTVRQVFSLSDFELPYSFPPDHLTHGFDNLASSMVIAPSSLEAFTTTANEVADELFPPPRPSSPSRVIDVPPTDLVISYSSACRIDGAMRLASSGKNLRRHATWPTKFEAPRRGRYHVQVIASPFGMKGAKVDESTASAILRMAAMKDARSDDERFQDVELVAGESGTTEFDIELNAGETIVMRYLNGPFSYDNSEELREFLTELFDRNPEIAAAWDSVGSPARGGSGWSRVQQALADGALDVSGFRSGEKALEKLITRMVKNPVSTGETLVYKFFEDGPGVAIENVRITGPIEVLPDAIDKRRRRQREDFLKTYFSSEVTQWSPQDFLDDDALDLFVESLLQAAYRRPVEEAEIGSLVTIIRDEVKASSSKVSQRTGATSAVTQAAVDRAFHLAIRTVLLSPHFLYRNTGLAPRDELGESNGELSPFELGSRLSYFLTSGPPDEDLFRNCDSGRLARSFRLRKEVKRLAGETFAEDFTRQWLHLHTLDNLMPDPSLIRKFNSQHRQGMIDEITQSFLYVLSNNLPIHNLVAPDFLFTNLPVAKDIYELPEAARQLKEARIAKQSRVAKLSIDRFGKYGGLLSMSGVMMATANGVDTQPVLRGVWVLENILGNPPPDPPDAVPALTPDITGATSPKSRLAAHMSSDACAVCHRDIDPLGFVLENYDAVGRWRDNYPRQRGRKAKGKKTGLKVDAAGKMPNGLQLNDVTDLKRWLAGNPRPLAQCLSEKWMTYATGRELNYRERQVIAGVVRDQAENGYRLADLLAALVDSSVFRTR